MSPIIAQRFGDFLEIVGPDAAVAAQALDITLTSNRAGEPMAGIPIHSAYRWLPDLATATGRPVQFGDETFLPEPRP